MTTGWTRVLPDASELTDPITGLQKGPGLDAHLWLAQLRSRTTGTDVAVVVADVADFSTVVGTHGWAGGDQVLAQVAQRFRTALRDGDVVARLFGDVFAGVCEGIEAPGTVDLIVERLARSLAEPYVIDGEPVELNVGLGTAIARSGETTDQVIRRAEHAIDRISKG